MSDAMEISGDTRQKQVLSWDGAVLCVVGTGDGDPLPVTKCAPDVCALPGVSCASAEVDEAIPQT